MNGSAVRRSGIAAVIAGAVWIFKQSVRSLIPDPVHHPIEVIFFLLMIVALLAMRSAQGKRDGALGRVGVVIAVTGAAILIVQHSIRTVYASILGDAAPDWLGILDLVGFPLGFLLGCVLFGIAAIRARVLPRWSAVLFTIGLPLGLVIRISTDSLLGFVLFGIGLLWLGYDLWSGTWVKAEAPSERMYAA